jgi:N-acetylglucosaminyl-diphospho-decaprenol L-rhamnosyltransferase
LERLTQAPISVGNLALSSMAADGGSSTSQLDYDIGIVTYNTRETTIRCVETLLQQGENPSKIWILDNASTDGTQAALARLRPCVRSILRCENRGFADGVNSLLEASSADFLVLLNSDARPQDGAIEALVGYLSRDARMAAAGGALQEPGRRTYCHDSFPGFWSEVAKTIGWYRSAPHVLPNRDVDWVNGAFMAIRTSTVSTIGRFDDGYFMYAEELDWCTRAHANGWRIGCLPNAVAVHDGGGSGGIERRAQIMSSKIRYQRLYRGRMTAFGLCAFFLCYSACAAASAFLRPCGDRHRWRGHWAAFKSSTGLLARQVAGPIRDI